MEPFASTKPKAAPVSEWASASGDISLSNGNLTATRVQVTDANYCSVLSTPPGTSGNIYAEVTIVKIVNQYDIYLGIANANQPLGPASDAWMGGTADSYGMADTGGAFNFVQGDVVAIAYSPSNKTLEFRNVTQNSAWSPPISVTSLGPPPVLLGATVWDNAEAVTANFIGPFLGALPPGYVGWGSAALASQGWGQKVYYAGYNVITAPPASIAPGNFAVRTYYDTHSPVALE